MYSIKMGSFWYLPLLITTISVLNLANSSPNNGCLHKNFGQDTTVCVCNENHCDPLGPIPKSSPGVLQLYSTSRDGEKLPDRFKRRDLHFKNASSTTTTTTITSKNHIKFKFDWNNVEKYQKILGFGGAITDAAGFNFKKLPESLQKNLIRDYFSPEGIEYSACRVTIAGSDMSLRPYSYDDYDHGDDFNLDHFKLQQEDLELKIPFLQMAQQATPHKPLKLFGSAWSPPAWMKTNNNLSHGGHLKGDTSGPYYQAYAKYLIRFIEEYQKQNVSVWGITIVNEPGAMQYNSLEMTATEQRDFIKKHLGPLLKKHNLTKLNVMIWDWNIPEMLEFVKTILSDPEAASYTSGMAFHWYGTNATNQKELSTIHKQFPNYFLLSTEACEIFANGAKDTYHVWKIAERYAKDIIGDLNNYAVGWIDWNMLLDMQGGPTWIHNYLNASIVVNADAREYYKQPAYYILGHFSKFLPPGSQRIDLFHRDDQLKMDTVAFLRPDGGKVAIMFNYGDESIEVQGFDERYGFVHFSIQPHSLTSAIWY